MKDSATWPLRGLSLTFKQALELRDPAEPIIFHFHARDADVRRHRVRFPGHRFGKDEAYYFLPAPKGAVPYTHVGLHPGVTRRVLAEAIAAGNGRLLELSPEEMHPGFASLDEALDLIDFATACGPRLLERHRLLPEPVAETRQRGGQETWIFPPRLRKISGKRLVVQTRFQSQEPGPYVAPVWRE